MKSLRLLTLVLTLPLLTLPVTSFAAKGLKPAKGAGHPGKVLRGYDANSNSQIDGDEIEAVRKAFDADKTGALKMLDKDADGKLTDEEITSAKFKAKGEGKKKKKNA